jgi:hypothetical protein
VTCDHTIVALNQVQTIEPTINADQRSITLDLAEGDTLRCDFFFGSTPVSDGVSPETNDAAETGEADEVTDPGQDPGTSETAPDPESEETTSPDTNTGDSTFGGGSPGDSDTAGTTGDTPDPNAGTDDPAMSQADSGTASSLSIQHYDCPNPVTDLTVDDLVETCTASVDPSAWTLNGESLAVGDGYAEWMDLEPNLVSVSNGSTEGKDDASSAVYCSIATIDGVPLVGLEVPVKNGLIDLVFDQSAVIYCAWFVAP